MALYNIDLPSEHHLNFDISLSSKFSYLSIRFKDQYATNEYMISLDCNLTQGKQRTADDIERVRTFSNIWQRSGLEIRNGSTTFTLISNSKDEAIKFINILNNEEPIDEQNLKLIIYCIENKVILKDRVELSAIQTIVSFQESIEPPLPILPIPINSRIPLFRSQTNISNALSAFIDSRKKSSESNLILSSMYNLDAKDYDLDCPISLDFPVIPVSFNGRLFDYNELIKLENDGFIEDPGSRETLSIQTIQPDFRAQKEMDKLIAKLNIKNKSLSETNDKTDIKDNNDSNTKLTFKK